ncbi:hypothetical protein LAV_00168 [Sphingobium phage Lacusarx]|uniref:Uncharacterized protein n=1 Tax=Sphingobium phage Lacusarx TaxID=1980139 RepID=A0A1W6DX95_9CAUD|nr:hypothetical protein FDH44_gp135 [Sphingobium phage Lacusarx]ARK07543.1 hypothetical protein LAV_00168 [Sphingobium phage Lacusarx]
MSKKTPKKGAAFEQALLTLARRIAADNSSQTGKNRENFLSGRYDHAYGVQTALQSLRTGIKLGREMAPPRGIVL